MNEPGSYWVKRINKTLLELLENNELEMKMLRTRSTILLGYKPDKHPLAVDKYIQKLHEGGFIDVNVSGYMEVDINRSGKVKITSIGKQLLNQTRDELLEIKLFKKVIRE